MIRRIDESGPSIKREDIDVLETDLGMTLPSDYRAFLLKHNGGRPTPNAFPIEGLENNPFGVIQVFFGIDDPIESCNVDWNYEVHNGRLAANLFPIACDDGGDLICLSLFGDDAGSVLFWDYHKEPPAPSYVNVYRIAKSFEEFLGSIQELPESFTE